MNAQQQYGIKHKVTGLFFAGFNADNSVKWNESGCAVGTFDQAKAQAMLLFRFDPNVQKQPVAA